MKNNPKQKNIKGMSLLESILAVGLVMSVVIGAITMSIYTIRIGRSSNNRIVAINLAREGMEYIRNLRDSNWLKESEGIINEIPEPDRIFQWDDGIEKDVYTLNQYIDTAENDEWVSELNFLSDSLDYEMRNCGTSCKLYITSDGIYSHVSGVESNFSRIIIITDKTTHFNIVSKIHWIENGGDKYFTLEENLFDWRDD